MLLGEIDIALCLQSSFRREVSFDFLNHQKRPDAADLCLPDGDSAIMIRLQMQEERSLM